MLQVLLVLLQVRMLTEKQSSVEWNVSRLERGLAIMHNAARQ